MRLSVVILPTPRWSEVRPHWARAEEFGLYAGYTCDHLSWRSFRDKAWFTMVPTLVAAATATDSIRLGPLVTTPNFRHPLVLAKDLLALDDISNGRAIVGIGSGGRGFDATVLGHHAWSADERHRRFEEFTRALDRLLREQVSTLDGPFYPVVDSRQYPGPVQLPRPPIIVSALGPKSLALCAEIADGWVSIGSATRSHDQSTSEEVATQVSKLNEELERQGQTESSMQRLLLDFEGGEEPLASFDAFIDWAGRYRALGFDELVVHWPVPDSPYDYDRAVFERVATEGHAQIASWD
jgi:alkanesulfonate monooxygenase SsuD/methylene tetrahydromethanopterin reductase-like flavin-dependent oxidoreductase (luciferase family)